MIPRHMVEEYYYDPEAYARAGKPPPRHYDERTAGQVEVFSYAEPTVGVIYEEPVGLPPITFDPRTLQPVIIAGPPERPINGVGPVVQAGIFGAIGGVLGEMALDWGIEKITGAVETRLPPLGGAEVSNGNGLAGYAGLVQNGGAVPVGGPGVPEPPRAMVAKEWKTKAFSHTVGEYWVYFFKLHDGRIMCYNAAKRSWKMWKPKKPIVLYRGKVTLSQAVKAQRMLDKLWKTVAKRTKALKLA